jgi:hypothetical protein
LNRHAWTFARGGGLQVSDGPEGAGKGSFTHAVTDLDQGVRRLDELGVDTSGRLDGDDVRVLMIRDPDGNSIAYAEATSPTIAR